MALLNEAGAFPAGSTSITADTKSKVDTPAELDAERFRRWFSEPGAAVSDPLLSEVVAAVQCVVIEDGRKTDPLMLEQHLGVLGKAAAAAIELVNADDLVVQSALNGAREIAVRHAESAAQAQALLPQVSPSTFQALQPEQVQGNSILLGDGAIIEPVPTPPLPSVKVWRTTAEIDRYEKAARYKLTGSNSELREMFERLSPNLGGPPDDPKTLERLQKELDEINEVIDQHNVVIKDHERAIAAIRASDRGTLEKIRGEVEAVEKARRNLEQHSRFRRLTPEEQADKELVAAFDASLPNGVTLPEKGLNGRVLEFSEALYAATTGRMIDDHEVAIEAEVQLGQKLAKDARRVSGNITLYYSLQGTTSEIAKNEEEAERELARCASWREQREEVLFHYGEDEVARLDVDRRAYNKRSRAAARDDSDLSSSRRESLSNDRPDGPSIGFR